MKGLHMVTFILLAVGGLVWLLVGLFGFDLASYIGAGLARTVYILVGVSAVIEIATHKKTCKMCGSSSAPSGMM